MELHDPSIVSATMPKGTIYPGGNSHKSKKSNSKNNNTNKNKNNNNNSVNSIANNFGAMNPINAFLDKLSASSSQDKSKMEGSILDYKPELTTSTTVEGQTESNNNQKIVYSINELLEFRSRIAPEFVATKHSELPNKKFWRLHQRFNPNSDGSNMNNNSNNNNMSNNNNNNKSNNRNDGLSRNERRNSRTKNNNNNNNLNNLSVKNKNPKQHNKHHSKDDNLLMNEEIMKFDGNFVSSGNSMQDFELWKSKMKELDANKGKSKSKNIRNSNNVLNNNKSTAVTSLNNQIETDHSISIEGPGLNESSSMMSDFFKLSNSNKEETAQQHNVTSVISTEQPNIGLSRSSSSKFSSFFNSSSNLKNSNDSNKEPSINNNDNVVGTKDAVEMPGSASVNGGGSRLMNFFKESSRSNTPINKPAVMHKENTTTSSTNAQQDIPGNFNNSNNSGSMHTPISMMAPAPQQQGQVQPQPIPMPLMQGPNSNTFFQGLLNKNKLMESNDNDNNKSTNDKQNTTNKHVNSNMAIPPPPGMMPPMPGMPQQNFGMMPPNMRGQHPMIPGMSMPPPGMMQFPPEAMNKQTSNHKSSKGEKDSTDMNQQQRFYPMMPPPPPGFVPNMQQFPPNMQPQSHLQFPPNMQQFSPHMQINNPAIKDNANNNNPNPNNANNLQRFFPNMQMNPQQQQ